MFNLCLTVYFSLWDVSRYHYLPPPNKNAKQTIYCFIIVYLNTWNLYTPCWDWLLPILTNGSSFGSRPWCGSVSWSVPSEARHKCPVSAAAGRAQGASLMHQGGLSGRSDASPEVWTEHVVSSERWEDSTSFRPGTMFVLDSMNTHSFSVEQKKILPKHVHFIAYKCRHLTQKGSALCDFCCFKLLQNLRSSSSLQYFS